jgi:hypothetical protein
MVGTGMTKSHAPKYRGAVIEFDGRRGTLLSFAAWDWRNEQVPETWQIVWDDEADKVDLVSGDDRDRVIDVTAKPVTTMVKGRYSGYSVELPEGTGYLFKRGGYWYAVSPGAELPGAKDYSGINTRQQAIDKLLWNRAFTVDPTRRK